MAGNIACFIAGCNNSVIGQCSGYKVNCGQFYCHTHAIGKSCGKCGRREAIDRTYQDYFKTAETIKKPEWSPVFAGGLIIIIVIAGFNGAGPFFAALALLGIPAILLIWYANRKFKKAKRTIDDIDKIKPGFRKFYRETYEKVQSEREFEKANEVFLGFLGAVAGGVADGVREGTKAMAKSVADPSPVSSGTPRDVEKAIRDLEKTIAGKK